MIQTDISSLPIWITVIIFLVAAFVYFMGIRENRKLHINQLNATVNIDSKMKRIEDIRKLSAEYLKEAYDVKNLVNQNISKWEYNQNDYEELFTAQNQMHYKRDQLLLYFSELKEANKDTVVKTLSRVSYEPLKKLEGLKSAESKNEFRKSYNDCFNESRDNFRKEIGDFLHEQWEQIYKETKKL